MNSPLSYIGGKSRIAEKIINAMPVHKTYVEVFCGAAWVYYKKDPSQCEILNDKDGNLVKFYRVLQNHPEEFLKQFKWLLSSHEWWSDWEQQLRVNGLTDIQYAARYYYTQRLCFGGKVKGKVWGVAIERPPRINLVRIEEELSSVHLRLVHATIENMDWSECIKRYDRETTFFYLDPPYFKMPFYNYNFDSIDDFTALNSVLKSIKGKFLMSINDTPEIRKCFDGFKMSNIVVPYSVSSSKKKTSGTELLVANY